MADDDQHQSDSEKYSDKQKREEEYDPTLDFCSDKFDPLKALTLTDKVKLPYPKAHKFNSFRRLGAEHELLNTDIEEREAAIALAKENAKATGATTSSGGGEPSNIHEANKRRFLPHQEPIKVERKDFKTRNMITRMTASEGPLQLLKNCLEKRKKVKIITRHGFGIRGYCTAYVEAFDKHLNMALADITEVWTRKKSRKIPALGDENQQEKRPIPRQVLLPKITIIKSDKKTETCQRNIPKLMIRGEHVVLISTVVSDEKSLTD